MSAHDITVTIILALPLVAIVVLTFIGILHKLTQPTKTETALSLLNGEKK